MRRTLTTQDMLDILVEWNIQHYGEIFEGERELEGQCDANKHTIEISSNSFRHERIYALIHEFLHARDFNQGYETDEKEVERMTDRSYRAIFGRKFMGKRK